MENKTSTIYIKENTNNNICFICLDGKTYRKGNINKLNCGCNLYIHENCLINYTSNNYRNYTECPQCKKDIYDNKRLSILCIKINLKKIIISLQNIIFSSLLVLLSIFILLFFIYFLFLNYYENLNYYNNNDNRIIIFGPNMYIWLLVYITFILFLLL